MFVRARFIEPGRLRLSAAARGLGGRGRTLTASLCIATALAASAVPVPSALAQADRAPGSAPDPTRDLGVTAPAPSAAVTTAPVPNPSPRDEWRNRPFDYAVVDQELRDVLIELGKRVGLNAVVTDGVRGRVRGRLARGTAVETLDRLAAIYGLDWFTDGSTLHVSAVGEAVSRLVDLGGVAPTQLDSALRALGVHDARWPIRGSDPTLGMAMVSGPPRYVALVEQTLAVLARRPRPDGTSQSEPARIRVFRGNTAPST